MRDGRVLSRRHNITPQDRAPESAVVRKFMDNTRDVLTPERAASLADRVLNLDGVDGVQSAGGVRALASALTATGDALNA